MEGNAKITLSEVMKRVKGGKVRSKVGSSGRLWVK